MTIKQKVYNRVFAQGTLTNFGKELTINKMDNKAGWVGSSFEFGFSAEAGTVKNIQGIKFFGGLTDNTKNKGFQIWENGEVKEVVKYEDRNNPDMLMKFNGGQKKTYINGDVKKEFLCEKEFVDFMAEEIKTLIDKKVSIIGEMEHNYSKGNVYKKLVVSRIEVLTEATGADKVDGQIQLFFNQNVISQEIYSGNSVKFDMVQELAGDDKKLKLDVFILVNNTDKSTRKDVPKIFIPTQVVINTDKIDWSSPVHKKMIAFLLKSFRCKDADTVYTIGYTLRYFSGYNSKQLTEDEIMAMFTEDEIEALDMGEMMSPGFKSKAISKKSGETKGDRISESRLICPHENTLVVEEALGVTAEHLDLYKSILVQNEAPAKAKPAKAEAPANSFIEETDFGNVFG
ncbi:MAG: hypothetical protein ACRCZ9_08495 [Fusobacteriaceae bacterium]